MLYCKKHRDKPDTTDCLTCAIVAKENRGCLTPDPSPPERWSGDERLSAPGARKPGRRQHHGTGETDLV